MPNLPSVRTMPAVGIARWCRWYLGCHHRGGAAQAQAARIKKFKQYGEFRAVFLKQLAHVFTIYRLAARADQHSCS